MFGNVFSAKRNLTFLFWKGDAVKPGQQWWESVASTLRQLRARQGLSQVELADRTGISQGLISRYERGAADPGIGKLLELLEAMNCTLEDFTKVFDQTQVLRSSDRSREAGTEGSASSIHPRTEARQEAFFLMRLTDEDIRKGEPEEARDVARMFECLRDFFQSRVQPAAPKANPKTSSATGPEQDHGLEQRIRPAK